MESSKAQRGRGSQAPSATVAEEVESLAELASRGTPEQPEVARRMIELISGIFNRVLLDADFEERQVRALRTKFRDSGRRSAPWRPTSSRVPGRPQDGADGNRINRWLLPVEHKFYADEITATLVEAKYYLQALSMTNAPLLPPDRIRNAFSWLLDHPIMPGTYVDPIQLVPIDLRAVATNARLIQSGHLTPLDRGGRHEPNNTFLMLARSNQLQGNLTVDELLSLMDAILDRHRERGHMPT